MKVIVWLKGNIEDLLSQPRDILTLRLTLLLLILHGSSTWTLDMPQRALCGLMLLSRGLLLDRWLWVILAALTMWINALHWAWIDNHKYLISYWCLACAFAVGSASRDRVLAVNGRWLVGLAFFFAVVWKLLGGEYLNGSFLHFTVLTDARLEVAGAFVGGLGPEVLPQNRLLMSLVTIFPDQTTGVVLQTSPRLELISWLASYWTLFIEGAVGVAFLVHGWRLSNKLKDALLVLFILTTYVLLPVSGFAFLLCVMGFAQCEVEHTKRRIVYLVLFILVQFIKLPWADLIRPG